jgi:uncharacterized membrane protein YgcG
VRATAKSRPAVRAQINRPKVPARVLTPPPTVTLEDHGGGDGSSGKDSGDSSGKGKGGGSGSGSGKDELGDD